MLYYAFGSMAIAFLVTRFFMWTRSKIILVISLVPPVLAFLTLFDHGVSFATVVLFFAALFIPVFVFGTYKILPKVQLPKPSGDFRTGLSIIELDNLRLHLFYPTTKEGEIARYGLSAHDISRIYNFPPNTFKHLEKLKTNSIKDAIPYDGAKMPFVFFSDGLTSLRTRNFVLSEELASQGAFVLYLKHKFDQELYGIDTKELDVKEEFLMIKDITKNSLIPNWLDEAEKAISHIKGDERFNNLIDWDRAFSVGLSSGASVATRILDSNLKATVSLDGPVYYDKDSFEGGFLHITSINPSESDEKFKTLGASPRIYRKIKRDELYEVERFSERVKGDLMRIRFDDSLYTDFTDTPFLANFQSKIKVNRKDIALSTVKYIKDFYLKEVLGEDVSLDLISGSTLITEKEGALWGDDSKQD